MLTFELRLLSENDAKACQRKVLTMTFSAFIIVYAICECTSVCSHLCRR